MKNARAQFGRRRLLAAAILATRFPATTSSSQGGRDALRLSGFLVNPLEIEAILIRSEITKRAAVIEQANMQID
jgi:hypothetical protein